MPTEGREQDIMDIRYITPQEVLDALNAAVEERGADFVYPINWRTNFNPALGETIPPAGHGQCQNYLIISDDQPAQPACIAGYVYHKLGFLNEVVQRNLNKASVSYLFWPGTAGGGDKRKFGDVVLDDISIEVLLGVQEDQDNGDSWGVARDRRVAPLIAHIAHQAELQAEFEADFGGENVAD